MSGSFKFPCARTRCPLNKRKRTDKQKSLRCDALARLFTLSQNGYGDYNRSVTQAWPMLERFEKKKGELNAGVPRRCRNLKELKTSFFGHPERRSIVFWSSGTHTKVIVFWSSGAPKHRFLVIRTPKSSFFGHPERRSIVFWSSATPKKFCLTPTGKNFPRGA